MNSISLFFLGKMQSQIKEVSTVPLSTVLEELFGFQNFILRVNLILRNI